MIVTPSRPAKKRKPEAAATTDAEDGAKEAGMGLQVTKPPSSIPHLYNNNFTVNLTYADNYQLTVKCDGTDSDSYLWRMNSIYDPDYTGAGHQPNQRDLWAAMYSYYTVLACDYKIKMYNASVDTLTFTEGGSSSQRMGSLNVNCMATTNTSDFTGTYLFPMGEMKNVRTKFLPPEGTAKFQGVLTPGDFIMDGKDADTDTTWTAVGSNPAVDRYLGIHVTPVAQATQVGQSESQYATLVLQVILNYTVQFTERTNRTTYS